MSIVDVVQPDKEDVSAAFEVLPQLRDCLDRNPGHVVRLVDGEHPDDALVVPRAALEVLARALVHMAAGEGVCVVPSHAELTTQQAADLLNVSRPFLIGLLEAGHIEYRTVGTHRRVKAESLLHYMAEDDQRRSDAAAELTALNQDMGL